MEIIVVVLLIISILLNIKFFLDLQRTKSAHKELEGLATIDPITKINNKYKIEMVLEEQIFISRRYDRNLCLIQFSIDEFSNITNTYGEKVYDEILKEVVSLISKEVRLSDVMARWNNQEFVVVLPETSMIHAVMLAEKLRQKIEIHQFENVESITACFGITVINSKDQVDTFVNRAQDALYKAKDSGPNKVEVI